MKEELAITCSTLPPTTHARLESLSTGATGRQSRDARGYDEGEVGTLARLGATNDHQAIAEPSRKTVRRSRASGLAWVALHFCRTSNWHWRKSAAAEPRFRRDTSRTAGRGSSTLHPFCGTPTYRAAADCSRARVKSARKRGNPSRHQHSIIDQHAVAGVALLGGTRMRL